MYKKLTEEYEHGRYSSYEKAVNACLEDLIDNIKRNPQYRRTKQK